MDLRYPTKFHALLASDGDADLTAFGIMDTSGCVGDVTWTSSCRSEQRRYRRCCKIHRGDNELFCTGTRCHSSALRRDHL
ncbi:hypothetical protein BDZ89DRAFT_1086342, partial [Hymenopellis radicata]